MITLFSAREACCGCSACMSICPQKAIKMSPDEEGFLYPVIDRDLCIECGRCVEVCDFQSRYSPDRNPPLPAVYAVKHKSDPVRMRSSSGGAFTALSDLVLAEGGVIYGAVFDDKFRVQHQPARNESERNLFCGSKYVQSDLKNVFKEIQKELQQNRSVLFSGTGCQVAGLLSFLAHTRTPVEKLLTVDLICHGTPSPKLFADYITFLESKYQKKIAGFYFRSKVAGWGFTQQILFTDGQEDHTSPLSQAFKELFLANICLRPACHRCTYARTRRTSDITLSDFKGIQDLHPDFADHLGISAMILNTEKGHALYQKIKENIYSVASNIDDLSIKQLNLKQPTPAHPKRNEFWSNYRKRGFEHVIKKYTGYGLINGLRNRLSPAIQNILQKPGAALTAKKGL
jgi:coenzyme F420-reducing hydrogenase beta subunit